MNIDTPCCSSASGSSSASAGGAGPASNSVRGAEEDKEEDKDKSTLAQPANPALKAQERGAVDDEDGLSLGLNKKGGKKVKK